eukprot:TRINITY_DN8673_c0_g1_i3.p2 TRINITY_DN8673_c0_g1~~TRINITY_DN8673_c0_g1_i3.p2  ORF type:complete len:151 (+),score=42.20 TRINITY_DN8673_c0_g1_i3:22-453(+)
MIRRPPRSTHCISSAASDVYKRQVLKNAQLNEQSRKLGELSLQFEELKISKEKIQGEVEVKVRQIEDLSKENVELVKKCKELDESLYKISTVRNREKNLLERRTKEYEAVSSWCNPIERGQMEGCNQQKSQGTQRVRRAEQRK